LPRALGGWLEQQQRGMKSSARRREGPPDRELVQEAVAAYTNRQQKGPRSRWQVGAASWVKKMHVDRGDVKVGVHAGNGKFVVLDSLKPNFVVPDLSDCKLRPYVSKAPPDPAASSPAEAPK